VVRRGAGQESAEPLADRPFVLCNANMADDFLTTPRSFFRTLLAMLMQTPLAAGTLLVNEKVLSEFGSLGIWELKYSKYLSSPIQEESHRIEAQHT